MHFIIAPKLSTEEITQGHAYKSPQTRGQRLKVMLANLARSWRLEAGNWKLDT